MLIFYIIIMYRYTITDVFSQTFIADFPSCFKNPSVFVSSCLAAIHKCSKIIITVHAIKTFTCLVLSHDTWKKIVLNNKNKFKRL